MAVHVVLGAGGPARETFWVIKENNPDSSVIFADPAAEDAALRIGDAHIPIIRDWDFSAFTSPQAKPIFSVAIEDPRYKQQLVHAALDAGLLPAPPVISPSALYRSDAVVGVGTVGQARAYISTNVKLGDFVLVLPMGGIAHDVTIGDFATCSSLCTICGYSVLGEGVYIGPGSSIREHSKIAPWVRIEMQSSVVSHIDTPGITVAGIPALPVAESQ